MSEPLLMIMNHHVPECGDPLIVADNDNLYVGYFENVHGEQWIFTFDRTTKRCELRGGDVGWNEVELIKQGKELNLILGLAERQWLEACWNAATAAT
jgi:hypothetical protein